MAGYKTFVAGEEALAADVNSYLMGQTVARFASAAARTSQLPAPAINQLSLLDSSPGSVQYWTGSAWANLLLGNVGIVKGTATTDATGNVGLTNPRGILPLAVFGQLVGGTNQSGNALVTAGVSTTGFVVVKLFDSRGTGFIAGQAVTLELMVIYPG